MIALSPLREAERILREHADFMEGSINNMMPRAGAGITIRGSYPVFVASGDDVPEDEIFESPDFQLKFTRSGDNAFRFTRGRVQAGSYVVVPEIGNTPVGENSSLLPLLSGGGQVFVRYAYKLDPLRIAPDWSDVFQKCDLVQTNLGTDPPGDVVPFTGLLSGVDPDEGKAHTLLMAYDGSGRILMYGQSALLDPDNFDSFPNDVAVVVTPLVEYVA